jgi:hypothetical protein
LIARLTGIKRLKLPWGPEVFFFSLEMSNKMSKTFMFSFSDAEDGEKEVKNGEKCCDEKEICESKNGESKATDKNDDSEEEDEKSEDESEEEAACADDDDDQPDDEEDDESGDDDDEDENEGAMVKSDEVTFIYFRVYSLFYTTIIRA